MSSNSHKKKNLLRKVGSPCNKRGYETKSHVRGVRDHQQATTGTKLYIYKCPKCFLFHLTHQSWGTSRRIT